MTRHISSTAIAYLISLALIGCSAGAPSTSTTAQTTAIPPTSTIGSTSTPSPTGTPQPTTRPTPTLIPTSNVRLTSSGPWLALEAATDAYGDNYYLWIVNADGSGLKQLDNVPVVAFEAQPAASQNGDILVAYVTQPNRDSPDIQLKLVDLPDGRAQTIKPLINDIPAQQPLDPVYAWVALTSGGLAWSPNGRQLAFVGQIDGPSLDVYVYDLDTRSIHRITSGADQAFSLQWSPNGLWVVHEAFDFVGMGGPSPDGIWAARSDGSGSVSLVEDFKNADGSLGDVRLYGWSGDSEVIVVGYSYDQESKIDAVNITSGQSRTLVRATFDVYLYAPEHDAWLLASPYRSPGKATLRLYHAGQVTDLDYAGSLIFLRWWPRYDEFLTLGPDNTVVTISATGKVTALPFAVTGSGGAPDILECPDGHLWAWLANDFYSDGSQVWVGNPFENPNTIATGQRVVSGPGISTTGLMVKNVAWTPDSQRLYLMTETGLWAADSPDFKPVQLIPDLYFGWGVWIP